MKKLSLLILSLLLLFSLSFSLISCSKANPPENESGSDTGSESGTLEGEEHLSPESGTVTFPDAEKTETETETQTEMPTEDPTQNPTEAPTETETEEITTEKETEAETEPPTSLKFTSYGNGTCAVSGIGNYPDVYVIIPQKSPEGDVVTAIDDRAFYDNTSIKAVQIPSTVMSVGKMAFGNCSSLIYISVDSENKMFTDVNGILYSKDKTKLYVFPAANQASEISLSVNLTEIADMAFFSTPSLKQIKYGGTLSDWSRVKIGEKNYGLYSASLSFAVIE
jgi:hypothetical protein